MKNKQEIYKALVNGEKLKPNWSRNFYFMNIEGELVDRRGNICAMTFCDPSAWEILKDSPAEIERVVTFEKLKKALELNAYSTICVGGIWNSLGELE